MLKTIFKLTLMCMLVALTSGCAVIGTAISAAVGYGIYQATKH